MCADPAALQQMGQSFQTMMAQQQANAGATQAMNTIPPMGGPDPNLMGLGQPPGMPGPMPGMPPVAPMGGPRTFMPAPR